MLTVSGANWFGRRAGTCRLHAIYMNQPCIYVGKVGETVKYGWARHPRRGTVGPTPRMQTRFCPFNMMLAKPRQAAERSYAASRPFAPFHPREARSRSE